MTPIFTSREPQALQPADGRRVTRNTNPNRKRGVTEYSAVTPGSRFKAKTVSDTGQPAGAVDIDQAASRPNRLRWPRLRFALVSKRLLFFRCGDGRDLDGCLMINVGRLQVRPRHGSRADALTRIVIQHRSLSELGSHPLSQPAFLVGVRSTAVIPTRVKAAIVTAFARIHCWQLIRHITRRNTRPDDFVSDDRTHRRLLRQRCFSRTIGIVCRLGQCEGGEHCQTGESQESGHRAVLRQIFQKTFQSLNSSARLIAELILLTSSHTDYPVRISGHEINSGRIRPPAESGKSGSRSGVVCDDSCEPGNSREVRR